MSDPIILDDLSTENREYYIARRRLVHELGEAVAEIPDDEPVGIAVRVLGEMLALDTDRLATLMDGLSKEIVGLRTVVTGLLLRDGGWPPMFAFDPEETSTIDTTAFDGSDL